MSELPGVGSSEYNAWRNMKDRCLNPRCGAFSNYGERGVLIYDPWIESFQAFIEHIGPKPAASYSLDRIDCNGHYEPGNVRWAPVEVQTANRRVRGKYGEARPRAKAETINNKTRSTKPSPLARNYPESYFLRWYMGQGYLDIDELERGGGVNICAEDIGVTSHYVRQLLRGKPVPKTGPLPRLLEVIEKPELLKIHGDYPLDTGN